MPKFRVALEATVAVGIEINVEADDDDAAEAVGQKWLNDHRDTCGAIVENLVNVDDMATRAYAEVLKLPISRVYVSEPDDEGFEVIETWEPD